MQNERSEKKDNNNKINDTLNLTVTDDALNCDIPSDKKYLQTESNLYIDFKIKLMAYTESRVIILRNSAESSDDGGIRFEQ